ncbi:MAG: hypothetical protein EPN77_19385 [Candidimonas sp.]|nr:MAG: hypothetical protein EPN77_19385 [Candidimonas sp.]
MKQVIRGFVRSAKRQFSAQHPWPGGMPLLLQPEESVRSIHVRNTRAEALLAAPDSGGERAEPTQRAIEVSHG